MFSVELPILVIFGRWRKKLKDTAAVERLYERKPWVIGGNSTKSIKNKIKKILDTERKKQEKFRVILVETEERLQEFKVWIWIITVLSHQSLECKMPTIQMV